MEKVTCECGKEFEPHRPNEDKCDECKEEDAMKSLAQVEPPEGGWTKNSDMDRL